MGISEGEEKGHKIYLKKQWLKTSKTLGEK